MIKKYRYIIIIIGVIAVMTFGRLMWLGMFQQAGQPYAKDGVLDLRGWGGPSEQTITLDGEWEFYPNVLLIQEGELGDRADYRPDRIEVPSNWNDLLLEEGKSNPYGFASYRLMLQIEETDRVYSIHVPSIRTSSELFINGKRLAVSGNPSTSAASYVPENIPYIASFVPDASGMIEVIIQVSNFSDSRGGGLIRSLKFGSDTAIYQEKQLSMATQQLIAAALVIQAVYLFVFFAIERRKLWLYLALALISFTVMMLNSSEDKLLLQWFPISYDWSYRILMLVMIILVYALLQVVSSQLKERWSKRLIGIYTLAAVIGVGVSIFIPIKYNQLVQQVIFIFSAPVVILMIRYVLRQMRRGMNSGIIEFLVFLCFTNHLMWWGINMILGVKTASYPFDLILGMILFSSLWVRRYFQMYTDQKELTDKLEEINRRKDEFLANTSHELRNPLHGMINMSQSVLERERQALHGDSIRDLEVALKVGRRMSYMLNDLLDVARMKDSSLRLHRQPVAVGPIVDGVMDMIRPMTMGKAIVLQNRIPVDFPRVFADENRVTQIFFNLLHNAVKFTDRGEIVVEVERCEESACLVVSDSGIGMNEETLRRIFEPYEQGESRHRGAGGFGLGLSISKQLVDLHGGEISVTSTIGAGSRFVFSLPLTKMDESEMIRASSSAAPVITTDQQGMVDGTIARNGALAAAALEQEGQRLVDEEALPYEFMNDSEDRPRVLLVDDDPVNLNVLVSLLSVSNYQLVTATDGDEALKLLDGREWDLVITDIMMPGMSGYELTRTIRKRFSMAELPIILLTARNHPDDIENGFLAGANDYVTKPMEAQELRSRVQALTHLKRVARERVRFEGAWLQAQIEPHFLLNVLNAIAALQATDPEQMADLIGHFGNFLREKFKFQNAGQLVPLSSEKLLVESYLYIEQRRFEERLHTVWENELEDEDIQIPPFSIQPLVENAVRHGLMHRREGGIVRISLRRGEQGVEITVADNGVGIQPEVLANLLNPEAGGGIGLCNVDIRLKRLYGSGLQIQSEQGQGTSVSFVIRP